MERGVFTLAFVFILLLLVGNLSIVSSQSIGGGIGVGIVVKGEGGDSGQGNQDNSDSVANTDTNGDQGNNAIVANNDQQSQNSDSGDNSNSNSNDGSNSHEWRGRSSALTLNNSDFSNSVGENNPDEPQIKTSISSTGAIVLNFSLDESKVVSVEENNVLLVMLLFNTLILIVSVFLLLKFDKFLIQK